MAVCQADRYRGLAVFVRFYSLIRRLLCIYRSNPGFCHLRVLRCLNT